MSSNRESNIYLLMKVHKPTLKTWAIIDTKHTLLGPVNIYGYTINYNESNTYYQHQSNTDSKYNAYSKENPLLPREKQFTADSI